MGAPWNVKLGRFTLPFAASDSKLSLEAAVVKKRREKQSVARKMPSPAPHIAVNYDPKILSFTNLVSCSTRKRSASSSLPMFAMRS